MILKRVIPVLIAMMFCPIPPALAHRVMAFASFNGKNVTVEGYFPGGGVVKGGEVKVLDRKNSVISVGRTDSHGKFYFIPEGEPPYTITIKAGPGHFARTILYMKGQGQAKKETAFHPEERNKDLAQARTKRTVTDGQCKAILHAIQGLRADMEVIKKAQQEVRFRDVIGGIGYIIGIFGIIGFMRSRRERS